MKETRRIFEKAVTERMEIEFPEKNVQIISVVKNNNVELRGLIVKESSQTIAPTIYLESFEKDIENGIALPCVLENLIKVVIEINKSKTICFSVSEFEKYENVKSNIFVTVINYNKNKQHLKEMPHKQILDLAIVCEWQKTTHEDTENIKITNKLLNMWKITEEEFIENAIKNTLCEKKVVFNSMLSEINRIIMDEEMDPLPVEEPSFYILTNNKKVKGAVTMLYPDVLKNIAGQLNSDFYIIPSSIHEVLIIPYDKTICPEELLFMVKDINKTCVSEQEILADSIYQYLKSEDILKICCS